MKLDEDFYPYIFRCFPASAIGNAEPHPSWQIAFSDLTGTFQELFEGKTTEKQAPCPDWLLTSVCHYFLSGSQTHPGPLVFVSTMQSFKGPKDPLLLFFIEAYSLILLIGNVMAGIAEIELFSVLR